MKILYTVLLPEKSYNHEIENIDFFIKSSEFYNMYYKFEFVFFSAHQNILDILKDKYGMKYKYCLIDFQYNEKMNERRAHEISFCKSVIFKYVTDMVDKFDYLFYTDSDIRTDSNEIHELCNLLENDNSKKRTFVNIPYVLRDLKKVSKASFGCYILSNDIIKQNSRLHTGIYNIEEKDNILYRVGDPDCNIRNNLIMNNYEELRALSINTRHYLNNINYVEYDQGVIKEF